MVSVAGIPLNAAAGDPQSNLLALGLSRSGSNTPANFDIPLTTKAGLENMSVSFAAKTLDTNGFTTATLFYSISGGAFINSGNSALLPPTLGSMTTIPLAVPTAANDAPSLVLRIELTNGNSNGSNTQTVIDNIQVNGTIVASGVPDTGSTLGLLALALAALFGASRIRSLRLA
jgi:hypothetical protein